MDTKAKSYLPLTISHLPHVCLCKTTSVGHLLENFVAKNRKLLNN